MNSAKRKANASIPRLHRTETCAELMVEGRPFIMLAGEVHNSSASSLEYMKRSWERLGAACCNTALVPIYWELVEPEEGRFDLRLVDGLVQGAREHGLRLVLLWFGTWKNASSSYAPAWVKTDLERFPRAQAMPGVNTHTVSPFSSEAGAADARAFAAVMRHLQEVDGEEQTAIMMQVENEPGLLESARDCSPAAEKAFGEAVPSELMEHLEAHRDSLVPELREIWEKAGARAAGTWSEVFGADGAEVFMAWHVARFIEQVAAAGRAEHPLPMYANAWLPLHPRQRAGDYPSGGPIAKVMDVWRAAAPSIDFLAPDIYVESFAARCAEYAQSGNPLFVPEGHVREAPANIFYALAQHDAIGLGPFGIDGDLDLGPLAEAYDFLSHMLPVIIRHRGTGRMVGVLEEGTQPQEVALGAYELRVMFDRQVSGEGLRGRGLIIAVRPEEYIVAGAGFAVEFRPPPGDPRHVEFLSVDEGRFRNGEWAPGRRLNGDELGVRLGRELTARRVKLHSFA